MPRREDLPLRLIKGTARRKSTKHVPDFPAATVEPPENLTPGALAHWTRLAPLLADAGVLKISDRTALRMLCESLADVDMADAELRAGGMTQTTPQGTAIPSPWVAIRRNAERFAHRLMGEFGLLPSSRSRIRTDPPLPATDAASRFFDPDPKG